MSTSQIERPVSSTRGKVTLAVLAIAAIAYVIAGVSYAAGQTLAIAGMSGLSYYAGYAAQVFAWPMLMVMHH